VAPRNRIDTSLVNAQALRTQAHASFARATTTCEQTDTSFVNAEAVSTRAHTSFVIATTIPISTTTTIATCVQNQVGGTTGEA
jgi:hypothetical protein